MDKRQTIAVIALIVGVFWLFMLALLSDITRHRKAKRWDVSVAIWPCGVMTDWRDNSPQPRFVAKATIKDGQRKHEDKEVNWAGSTSRRIAKFRIMELVKEYIREMEHQEVPVYKERLWL